MEARDTARLAALSRALAGIHEAAEPRFGIRLWDGSVAAGAGFPLKVVIRDPRAVASLVRRPGLATLVEAWSQGAIDVEGGSLFDLAEARPRVRTRALLRRIGKRRLARALLPFLFAPGLPRLGRTGARRDEGPRDGRPDTNRENVAYHYDVSNDFYRLFLDTRMVYTCAYFRDWDNDLDTAQHDKLDMVCRKLRLAPGDRFLDIGCGWGALVLHAAEHYGVEAHGVTLSAEQLAVARERVAARGLEARVRLDLADFSQISGEYDKIASVGMFEHVGIDSHAVYFAAVARLLRPRGLYLHHAIVRRAKRTDREFRRARPEYRAITRYIFPGGEVDHLAMTARNLEVHGFEIHDVESWREHYARTTRLWAERLEARREEAIAEAGEEVWRLWIAYLTGVSIAFSRGTVGICQTLASKRDRGPSGLPPTRADLYR